MKRMGVWIALLSSMLMASACQSIAQEPTAQATVEEAEEVSAATSERDGWELVFHDEFDRDELGDNWIVADGSWEVEDGMLKGSGTLISAEGYPKGDAIGFQRLEFKASTDVKPLILLPGGPPPKLSFSDASSFIHAAPYEEGQSPWQTGYFFQFGGFNNTLNQIRKQGTSLVEDRDPEALIEQDKVHHIIVENDKGRLRMIVDGKVLLDHTERMSLVGPEQNRLGFYFYTAFKVEEVKLYVKQLPSGLDLE